MRSVPTYTSICKLIVKANYIEENFLREVVINEFDKNFNLKNTIQSNKIDIKNKKWLIEQPTITINNTNISELIEKKSFKRVPGKIYFNVSDNENGVIWNASHDGYLKNFKKIVKRNIKISSISES